VINNTFKNLKGRGIVAYGVGDIIIKGNSFSKIKAEAIEVDHYSSGKVFNNDIEDSAIAIQLDDAFDTVVKNNRIKNCRNGIALKSHFFESWINKNNTVHDNHIQGPGTIGIFISKESKGISIIGNMILDFKIPLQNLGSNNTITRNKIN